MIYKETPNGFSPWNPAEPINGTRYPSNIESLWAAADLKALGLYKVEQTQVPEGKRLVSSTVARVGGVVQFVHVLEDTPAPTPADFPLSDRQLRIGLITAGISLATVDQAIDAMPNATEKAIARVWWDRTTVIHWGHPMRAALTALAGITEKEAAVMWMAAKDIEA